MPRGLDRETAMRGPNRRIVVGWSYSTRWLAIQIQGPSEDARGPLARSPRLDERGRPQVLVDVGQQAGRGPDCALDAVRYCASATPELTHGISY
jgi:hypothetical protein